MIKAIAIDDEPLALMVLDNFSKNNQGIELVKTFTNPNNALLYLKSEKIDLVFLDIQMPSVLGTELAKLLDPNLIIVFTTAYSEFAVEGFNLNASDYLLKPFTFERFEQCIAKVQEIYSFKNAKIVGEETIVFKTDYTSQIVHLKDIQYIEGYDDYLKIHRVNSSPLVVRMTFKTIIDKLPSEIFVRIHRSYVVSKLFIKKFNSNRIEIGERQIPVGALYKGNLKSIF